MEDERCAYVTDVKNQRIRRVTLPSALFQSYTKKPLCMEHCLSNSFLVCCSLQNETSHRVGTDSGWSGAGNWCYAQSCLYISWCGNFVASEFDTITRPANEIGELAGTGPGSGGGGGDDRPTPDDAFADGVGDQARFAGLHSIVIVERERCAYISYMRNHRIRRLTLPADFFDNTHTDDTFCRFSIVVLCVIVSYDD